MAESPDQTTRYDIVFGQVRLELMEIGSISTGYLISMFLSIAKIQSRIRFVAWVKKSA
jgi:hypothetical protein